MIPSLLVAASLVVLFGHQWLGIVVGMPVIFHSTLAGLEAGALPGAKSFQPSYFWAAGANFFMCVRLPFRLERLGGPQRTLEGLKGPQ